MNKSLLFSIFFIVICLTLNAQIIFQKTYGGTYNDYGYSVEQTNDGGYIIAGETTSFGITFVAIYLVKTDKRGDTLWTKTYANLAGCSSSSVRQTNDNGYIVAGYGLGYNEGTFLIKTDSMGTLIWSSTYPEFGQGDGWNIQVTASNDYIVTGSTSAHYAVIYKIDNSGNTLWAKTFGGFDWSYVSQETTDHGYVIVGKTDFFGSGGYDVCLVKTDSIGNLLWAKAYGGIYDDVGYSVRQTSDGGYVIAGYTNSFGAGQEDVYVIKTDSTGSLLWSKTFGGLYSDEAWDIQQTSDGGYIIGGEFSKANACCLEDYVIKIDMNGNMLWSKGYGGSNIGNCYSIGQTNDGGYIIGGYTNSFGAGYVDFYLIKTDSLGNSGCAESNIATITTTAATKDTIAGVTAATLNAIPNIPSLIESNGGKATALCFSGVGINELSKNESLIYVYPNPVTDNFTIKTIKEIKDAEIIIYDMVGKEMMRKEFIGKKQEMEKGNLQSGVYFVKISSKEIESVQKLIVE